MRLDIPGHHFGTPQRTYSSIWAILGTILGPLSALTAPFGQSSAHLPRTWVPFWDHQWLATCAPGASWAPPWRLSADLAHGPAPTHGSKSYCDVRRVCERNRIQITDLYGKSHAKHGLINGGAAVSLSLDPHCHIHATVAVGPSDACCKDVYKTSGTLF